LFTTNRKNSNGLEISVPAAKLMIHIGWMFGVNRGNGPLQSQESAMNETRRRFIALAGMAPVALLGARAAFGQARPACVDPNSLPLAQKNMRRSVGYVDPGPDAAKRCGGCAFFMAKQGSCGTCQILSGGPVAQTGYCTSFAPKP
jgi:hypothetical protein